MDCVNSALLATLTFHNIYCYHINVELGGPRCPGKCFNKFSPKWEFDHMTIRQARWPATEPTMWPASTEPTRWPATEPTRWPDTEPTRW